MKLSIAFSILSISAGVSFGSSPVESESAVSILSTYEMGKVVLS